MTGNSLDERQRLFVALEVPATWQRLLGQLQEDLRTAIAQDLGEEAPRLRWTRPEGIHLTLKFLGETPRKRIAAVDYALREAVAGAQPFRLSLGKTGSFDDRRGARVLFAGIEGDIERLVELARKVDSSLGQAEFPRERRPLQPHLTLARLPESVTQQHRRRIAELTVRAPAPRSGPFTFDAISLMRSHLERGGARYERVRAYRLV